ncbi:MAG: Gldg family protein [Clostridia bacterium]|nr:Gldg family protein [Clostridia bacterium]
MKLNDGFRRKLRYGSTSLGIVAAVIAAVILLNLGAGILMNRALWFIDLTTEPMYGLTEQGNALLGSTIESANATRPEEEPVEVDIIFCADPDMLYGNEKMRYIYYTALQMEKAYSDTINVTTVDVWENPSAVDAYRTNSYSSIYQTNVIVASGTEFRVYNYKAFYTYSSETDTEPWAYNAEKTFIKGIMAVTRAEAPICAITVGHGEPFDPKTGETEYTEFLKVIEGAGYDIAFVDLKEQELPENCRLVVTFDPQTDFLSGFFDGGVSELSKLEKHLEKAYSYMVFVDADTPKLTNLEEFLEQWGIAFERHDKNATFEVVDVDSSLNIEGTTVIGQYASDGLGGSLTTDMRETGGSPKVIFGNALSITYSPTYEQTYQLADEEKGTGAYTYDYYYKNNRSRDIYDVFTASDTAIAYAKENGTRVNGTDGAEWKDTSGNYKLMTISRQTRIVGEGKGYTSVQENTYVCTVGSTAFASNEALSTNSYGNTDILLSAMRTIGREIVPVGFDPISMYDDEMSADYYTEGGNTAVTVVLALLPVLGFGISGFVILIRRRVRS